jgi:hypothetical protein
MNTKDILIYPTYFPSISHYIAMIDAQSVTFEVEDTFQKQTNRNRMYVYSPNGIQMLNISVKHDGTKCAFKDIKIDYQYNWQKNHFKSLEAAYKNSPFYEYFIDDLQPIFEKKHEFMLDLNFEIFERINDALGISIPFEKTTEYYHEVTDKTDFRYLVNGKKDSTQIEPYTQVFDNKYGFINNLSILDLLFNEGRYAVDYLKQQHV